MSSLRKHSFPSACIPPSRKDWHSFSPRCHTELESRTATPKFDKLNPNAYFEIRIRVASASGSRFAISSSVLLRPPGYIMILLCVALPVRPSSSSSISSTIITIVIRVVSASGGGFAIPPSSVLLRPPGVALPFAIVIRRCVALP